MLTFRDFSLCIDILNFYDLNAVKFYVEFHSTVEYNIVVR